VIRAVLIERADLALYHAQAHGRNRVVTWAEALAAKQRRRAKVGPSGLAAGTPGGCDVSLVPIPDPRFVPGPVVFRG